MKPLTLPELRAALARYDSTDDQAMTLAGYSDLSANCVHSARTAVDLAAVLSREQANRPLMPGESCVHKNGGEYIVIARVLSTGTFAENELYPGVPDEPITVTDPIHRDEQVVIYRQVRTGRLFVRPARLFDEAGRFTRIVPERTR